MINPNRFSKILLQSFNDLGSQRYFRKKVKNLLQLLVQNLENQCAGQKKLLTGENSTNYTTWEFPNVELQKLSTFLKVNYIRQLKQELINVNITHYDRPKNKGHTEIHHEMRTYADKIFKREYVNFFFAESPGMPDNMCAWINDGNVIRLTEREIVMKRHVNIDIFKTGVSIRSWAYQPDELYCVNYKQHEPEYVDDTWNAKVKHNFKLLHLFQLNLSRQHIHRTIPDKNNLDIYYILEFETGTISEDKIWRLEEIQNSTHDIFKAIFIFAKEIPTIKKPEWIEFMTFDEIKSKLNSGKDKFTPYETAFEAWERERNDGT